MNKDFCSNVVTIPQFVSTCWFNAILMMFFYSQNSRKLLLNNNHLKNSKDPLIKLFNKLLNRYYINPKEAFQYLDIMRPENILNFFNFERKMYKSIIYEGGYGCFIIPILMEKINMSYIMLEHYDNNFYIGINERIFYNYVDTKGFYFNLKFKSNEKTIGNVKKNIINKIKKYTINQPKYLIINLWEKTDGMYYKDNEYFYSILANVFDIKNYKIDFSNLHELKDKIIFNGYTYILDSCYLGNYNQEEINKGHAICGITCKNNRFVYNGWFRTTQDPGMKEIGQDKFKYDTLPCELMKFNWDIHDKNNKFCLNSRLCSLDNLDKTDNDKICFSFNKSSRILIYVLQDESFKSQDVNISSSKSIKSKKEVKPKEPKPKKEDKPKEPKTKKEVKPKETKPKKEVKPKETKTNKEDKPKETKPKKEVKPKETKTKKEVKLKDETKTKTKKEDETKTKKEVKPKETKPKLKDETKTKEEVKKICPQGKILNPLTNRCINIKK